MRRSSVHPTFCECGDHAFAPITRGFVVLVSPEDADILNLLWFTKKFENYYGVISKNGGGVMARVPMKAAPELVIDHRNGDATDNRRPNLRECTVAENQMNRRRKRGKVLPKGVSHNGSRYLARVARNGKTIQLGQFDTPEEASAAYARAARELHGQFARVD